MRRVAPSQVDDPNTERGRRMEQWLPFEGFLEALCRVAMLKALPTMPEVVGAGFSDAGQWLYHLRMADEEAYERLLNERSMACAQTSPPPTHSLFRRCTWPLCATLCDRVPKSPPPSRWAYTAVAPRASANPSSGR
jgi:hypothetical protein